MDIANEFKALAEEWETYCESISYSSIIFDYLDHPAYRKLIALGMPAVPYIMERYKNQVDRLDWGFVLQEITGVEIIPDPYSFRPSEVRRRWIEWWDKTQSEQKP